ncbi:MAG: 4-hydroxy-tetrahydrodipicolinate reductase [Alphaproteobacteria bacterium]|nr:4-hydroxy-tetrahydrodipicolinate reductase [Alphaproteobacteria bacterium]
MTTVVIIGAAGRMGRIADETLADMDGFEVVARVGRSDDLATVLEDTQPDIAVELTDHLSVLKNAKTLISHSVRPVIGASGLSASDIAHLQSLCKDKGIGGVIAPNFSLAMALTNQMVQKAAQYYSDVSIIEYHHAAKKDKPSGTARYTANSIGLDEEHIVSVRSDGFLAKQQVYFAGTGERLLIDHESFSRESFKKGIRISCEKAVMLDTLVLGLENII